MLIVYAGTQLLTGDEIALALVDYSQELARMGAAESIEVPVRDPDGTQRTAIFLVGPSSQLVAKSVDAEGDELIDEDTVAKLKARTRRLRPPPMEASIDEWI